MSDNPSISIKVRSNDVMAFVTGKPEKWECAKTEEEAIEKLLVSLGVSPR